MFPLRLSLLSVCAVLGTPCSFDLGTATKLFCYLGNCKAKGSQQTEPGRLLTAGGCILTEVLSVMPPVPLSAVPTERTTQRQWSL